MKELDKSLGRSKAVSLSLLTSFVCVHDFDSESFFENLFLRTSEQSKLLLFTLNPQLDIISYVACVSR